MNKLYLLNEATHHQIECNTICQRLYYHLASLQRESGAIRATVKHIADGVGISESGARYWMLLMQDAAVITMERHGKYYDITVNETVSFITTTNKNTIRKTFMITMLYWTLFIYITVYYSGMFSVKRNNNNEQKRTQRNRPY